MCVWGVEVNRKMRITNYKRINKVKKTASSVVRGHTYVLEITAFLKKKKKMAKGGKKGRSGRRLKKQKQNGK